MPYKDPDAQREAQRLWMAGRRASFFADKACVDCGTTVELTLHHRDPAEKEAHAIWSWSAVRRAAEIAKCDVLCGPCHRELHAAQRRRHGTASRYSFGCRCEPCRAAKVKANAKYLASRRLREAVSVAAKSEETRA